MFPEGRALEFLIAAVVALVVVGPKDLPVLMRRLGQFTAKLRGMAAEFRASFDEMARQSELDELRREVEAMRRGQFMDAAAQSTHAEIQDTFQDIHQSLNPTPETPAAPAMGGASPAEIAGVPGDVPFAPVTAAPEDAPAAAPQPAAAPKKPRARKKAADGEGASSDPGVGPESKA